MSWQAYVDTNLVGSGKVTRAAIIGAQGGVWAASPGYIITPEEQQAIIGSFANPNETQQHGVRLAGQKFFTLQATTDQIYGKKGADGCAIVKTKQAILVSEYVAPIVATEATLIVERLGDYLKSVGY